MTKQEAHCFSCGSITNVVISLLFVFLCVSVQGATLGFAFQLGEKQEPRLDRLLSDVARHMAFSSDSKKLIAKGMGGIVVKWDVQSQRKLEISYIQAKRWFAYSIGANQMLVQDVGDNVTVLSLENGEKLLLTNGRYEIGSLSTEGTLAVLSKGDDEVEVWQLAKQDPKTVESEGSVRKLKVLQTSLPVRNGLTLSDNGQFIAAAEGTYRDGEGHRTAIEVWNTTDERRMRIFDTGEILGVWNVLFSPDATMLAVDTQKNAQSGIRVWEVETGRQLLAKSEFEAYWTRALAFSPTSDYLASGGEGGNLRIWDISEGESVIWETYPTGIQALAFSPNGEYLAVAFWDATIQILRWRENNER